MLDAKLTFRDHVDTVMSKANRMLGLLMRSMQLSSRARMPMFDHRAVLCAYNAHVRSILEYGSVIWGGAAVTHLARLERLQHRFLMWLGAKTHERCSMDYAALSRHFQCPSIKARFVQSDVRFVRSVFGGRLDCSYLVAKFALVVPGRRSRHTGVLNVPFGRVDTVKRSYLIRVPKLVNEFLHRTPHEDMFQPTAYFRANLAEYANSVGSYIT